MTERPSMDQTLMEIARVMARRGTCSRAQVGAVIALDGRVLTSGYNGAPRGLAHCLHPPDEVSDARSPNAPTCALAVHAEANAVAFAARNGIALNHATLYTTLSPCVPCAQLVVNAGVRITFIDHRYRDLAGVRLLAEAGIVVFSRYQTTSPFGGEVVTAWRRDSGDEVESPL